MGLTVPVGCDAPPELRPDPFLVDSLGLTARDRVHTVTLTLRNGGEVAGPAEVEVRPGDWVSFESRDGFIRMVTFEADSLSDEARRWVDAQGIGGSPPLLNRGTRWLIRFQDAPQGRYPFRVEGNRAPGGGAVIVGAVRRFPFYTP